VASVNEAVELRKAGILGQILILGYGRVQDSSSAEDMIM